LFRSDTGELITEEYSARILVVEDDEFFLNMVLRAISRMGHQATGVKNGIEAVERYKSRDFDLVIIDLNLPGKSGIEVIREIRTFDEDLQAIIISGVASMDVAIDALREGVYDFLKKPLDSLVVLEMAVKRALHDVMQKQLNKNLMEELHLLSTTDPLTGLFNRRNLITSLSDGIEKARQNKNTFFLVMFDVDKFKMINDQNGHLVGDQVLTKISKIFKNVLRETDKAFRYGGDEFIILMENTTLEGIERVCARINAEVEKIEVKHGHVSMSVGVVQCEEAFNSFEEILMHADKAMYNAKADKSKGNNGN
jgi:two-component system cell cycle response regulator